MDLKNKTIHKKRNVIIPSKGRLYIKATFNNTLVTLTDSEGKVLLWGSSGRSGFKGSRKSTPYAATTAIENLLKQARESGLRFLEVYIKGPGPGRDAVLRVLRNIDLKIGLLADITPMPHNGTRPKKRRRI